MERNDSFSISTEMVYMPGVDVGEVKEILTEVKNGLDMQADTIGCKTSDQDADGSFEVTVSGEMFVVRESATKILAKRVVAHLHR